MDEQTLEKLGKEARREYYRKWRANNKERVKKSNRTYWERKALKNLAQKGVKDDRS